MPTVNMYTPATFRGIIQTPTGAAYKVQPGQIITVDQNDELFLLGQGFSPSAPIAGAGTGSVTSVVASAPLTGGTVTTAGTLGLSTDGTMVVTSGTLGVPALVGNFTGTITAASLASGTITVAGGVITKFA
jgi:hypothetical protein